jgi:asparagine synthase (glutamine-hydrolysing)
MCGICGELSLGGFPVSENSIRAMAAAIHYRGPDDSGFYVEERVGLGHLRLAILDTSSRGHQPMWSADGTLCIVFNGEIYNYREIARELRRLGCRLRSSSDTEVVVNAVRVWGVERAVQRFIGMFAFAVWDRVESRLTFVRDRVGVKPLFYAVDDARVLFGSELRALLAHPSFQRKLDPGGVGQFFVTGFTLGETTVFRNVRRVLPGHIVSIDLHGRVTETEYWNLSDFPRSTEEVRIEDAADELQTLLESAIGYRLVSDVPVANFLSGGVDSSLVASVLKRDLGQDILNITIGFRETAFDESPKAALVAKQLGLNHVVHYVSSEEVGDTLRVFPEIFDEPFGDTSGIPTYILARIARQHVKVALSADGGDEQFCGYDSYGRYADAWGKLHRVPIEIRHAASAVGRRLPWRALAGLAAMGALGRQHRPQAVARIDKALRIGAVRTTGELVRTMFEKAWTWEGARAMVGGTSASLFDRSVLADPELAGSDEELVDIMMRADYRAFLRDDILTKVDRASMHVSLEARDPLLDHRLAEFAFRLPLSVLFHGGQHKRLLKFLLRRTVSNEVVDAPKRGFSIPLYAWIRTLWKPIVLEFLSDESVQRVGVLNPLEVRTEVSRFYQRPGQSAERIWMMLNFQMWAERWLR